MSMSAESKAYRLENAVRAFLLKKERGGIRNILTLFETAEEMVRQLNKPLTPSNVQKFWNVMFDMKQRGTLIEEPDTLWVRLATVDELKAQLSGHTESDKELRLGAMLRQTIGSTQ